MMQGVIVSMSPKGTPPPPSRKNHYRRHHLHDSLAMRHDINPATYYAESRSGLATPPGAGLPHHTSRPRRNHGASSCMNLLSHSNESAADSTPNASSSMMDLWSYTTTNTITQQGFFEFMDADGFHLRAQDEFNHHNEFATSSASHSNLYDSLKEKNADNRRRQRHKQNRSSIAKYMRFMTMSDGEDGDEAEGVEKHQYQYDFEPNFEPQCALPPQITFDSVNDIFNLVPEDSNDTNPEQKQDIKHIENKHIGTGKDGDDIAIKHRCFIDKIREIFDEHDLNTADSEDKKDDDSIDNDAVFANIYDICQDLVGKKNKLQKYEHKYKDLERFLSRLKKENKKLKRKNNELEQRMNLNNISKENILQQMSEYITELMEELPSIAGKYRDGGSPGSVYKYVKSKLMECNESLADLAHDLNDEDLHCAVEKLKKGIDDIDFLDHHGVYKQNHLEHIMKTLVKEFNDKRSPNHMTPKQKECDKDEAQVFEDEDDEKEIEVKSKLSKYAIFEEECPRVLRIDIDGGWFNKKTRAIIKYRGHVFGRKEADFKWLYKMMQCDFKWLGNESCDGDAAGVIPDFNKELPHNMWNANYLTKRKRELNLFLMQCHSLRNIKNGKPYDIFLEQNKEQWKRKRNEFDKIMLNRIKRNDR